MNQQRDPVTGERRYFCVIDPSKWSGTDDEAKALAFAKLTVINETLDDDRAKRGEGDALEASAKALGENGIWYMDYRDIDDFKAMASKNGWSTTFEVALPAPKGWVAK